ncbi:PREDICTED: hematological and neurological expressed 1 protein isoform X2 [Ceratotherium simum simum]|uniref:Hematological and neurological expressed 1 protein isoform X2 n=1 Tax=Ceratotherium simum simum TaxID=73337 RepID=A0ABM1CYU7_CERSS|nr:PREDICTED: hematological and neurological expressed 1 protein isoform X2 [Ceratotherium simum simum]
MTTTTTFKGVDPNSRNSSRVLRPPGGGSNFSLGFDEPTEQPVRRNKMASSIFGTPEENPPSWAKSAGAKSTGGREDSESSGLQRRNSSEANSGDFLDLKKTWTQTCRLAWGRVRRSPCLLPLCPARWHLPQCRPEETRLAASPASSWVSSDCPELCCFICFLHACELHNLSLTVHLLICFIKKEALYVLLSFFFFPF